MTNNSTLLSTKYVNTNYVIIYYKNHNEMYLRYENDRHYSGTSFLNKAMKFYTYKDAINFVNKFKIKHYKIKSIQCIIELIK